jgi:hypothetical protein
VTLRAGPELFEWRTMMTEPVFSNEPGKNNDGENPASGRQASTSPDSPAAGREKVRLACASFDASGTIVRWGLAASGLLFGVLRLISEPGGWPSGQVGWSRALVAAAIGGLVFGVAGWALGAFCRLTAALVLDHQETATRVADDRSIQVAKGIVLLERALAGVVHRETSVVPTPMLGLERARALAEIIRATNAADWVEADKRLSEFETGFPDDPELETMKDDLASARAGTIEKALAELDAAREVNDPDRVLEIHAEVAVYLEPAHRTTLDQELAKWFLSLIHRRLRTGKVQADVVQLAARFAESFAATVEGASVRASLSTLRRSVGLCPKCAQPYTGVADACPDCKKGAGHGLATATANNDTKLME